MSEFYDQLEPEELEQPGFILVPLPEDEEYGDDVRAFIDPADPIDDFVEAATTNHRYAGYFLGLLGETERNIAKLSNGYFADRTFSSLEIGEMYGVRPQAIRRVRKQAYDQMHGEIPNWYQHTHWPELSHVPMPPESKKLK